MLTFIVFMDYLADLFLEHPGIFILVDFLIAALFVLILCEVLL